MHEGYRCDRRHVPGRADDRRRQGGARTMS